MDRRGAGTQRPALWRVEEDAIQRVRTAAQEIVLNRIAHGELPPDSAQAVFDIAA